MEHASQFITIHWQLCVALIIVLLAIFINEFIAQKKRGKELSPAAAVDMINHENAIIMDLRDADTYRKGHIIDSINTSANDFGQQRMDKYKTKPIILVCARGLQSIPLTAKLRTQGFTHPMVLSGGIAAWQTAGLPLVKGKS